MILCSSLCLYLNKVFLGVPVVAQCFTDLTSIHEDAGLISGLPQWVKDLVLLWLWCRPAAAAPVWSLVWDHPYAAGAVLKKKKEKRKKEKAKWLLSKNTTEGFWCQIKHWISRVYSTFKILKIIALKST